MSYWDGSRWVSEAPAAPAPRRRPHRLLGATAEAGLITLLMFGLIAGATFAAKGGHRGGGGGAPSGTCDVAPTPVTVGAVYYVTAYNVPPDTVFNVRVTDSNGVQVFFLGSDPAGTGTGSTYAYATGAHSVEVTYSERRKNVVAARCAFDVY